MRSDDPDCSATATYELGLKTTAEVIMGIWQVPPPTNLAQQLPINWAVPHREIAVAEFRPRARVLVLEDDEAAEQLLVRDEEQPAETVRVQYNLADRNDLFSATIALVRKVTGFPVSMNLLDVEIDDNGIYRPRAFVLEPDYLIDASGIAECFHGSETHPWGYLLKKFLPFENSIPLLLGHIANFFLDELMTKPEVTFQELKSRIFNLSPLAFCLFSDREIRELIQKSQGHFIRLKQLVQEGLGTEGVVPEQSYLEPSFYSELYGLQGRLDLLHRPNQADARTAIVELKSGKPYKVNRQGISPNHYIQTLLYDLLVRSAFGASTNVGCFILYSREQDRPLRFAPLVKAQQYEALQIRNQLVAIEYLLAQLGQEAEDLLAQTDRLLGRLQARNFPRIQGFAARDLERFSKVYQSLSSLERKYVGVFSGFIAREQLLAKTGVQGTESINGLASLWLNHAEDKEQNYQRLAQLELAMNQAKEEEPLLIFLRTEQTNPLANFRVGDIAVLFPASDDGHGMLDHQIFKCTIVELDAVQVKIRLRSRQFNDRIFREQRSWNLEHDLLDSSFAAYYRGLFSFAQSTSSQRALLLGTRPPAELTLRTPGNWPANLTEEQGQILDQMIATQEYFLLWGPPGTGKTSVMLHHLVRYLLLTTQEQLLLLAYTNRAVDEICESLERIGGDIREQYLRIGSRYGTAPRFQEQLLQKQIEDIGSRRALRELISSRRIVVGTVASLASRTDLFQLKTFDRVIIDEASQILEPLLVGLLPRFNRWILIGDHRQLPAVVTQRKEDHLIKDEELRASYINDTAQSLFERLYLTCQRNNWDWAYAQLSHQGRMHTDIMQFPAKMFYSQQLSCLPGSTVRGEEQSSPLSWQIPLDASWLEQRLCEQRLLFLSTPVDYDSPTLKTNRPEAELIGQTIAAFFRLQQYNQIEKPLSLGIITPYRAQIAQIRHILEQYKIATDEITIDTVERYQGGARDIVLISLCTNSQRQLEQLSVLSAEGIDRKLNVAMTRAREHLVIFGNAEILKTNPVYHELIESFQVKKN